MNVCVRECERTKKELIELLVANRENSEKRRRNNSQRATSQKQKENMICNHNTVNNENAKI